MGRRMRAGAQPVSGVPRKRRRVKEKSEKEEAASNSGISAACEEEDSIIISELEQLLGADEATTVWWKEDAGAQPGDATLEELLQQLAACDDVEERYASGRHDPHFCQATSAPPSLAANAKAACGNRNAQAARLNRLRKKEYVRGLEGTVARISEDNKRLERDRLDLRERVRHLEDEFLF